MTTQPAPVLAVIVPDVIGRSAPDAEGVISSSGFTVGWAGGIRPAGAAVVVSQEPAGGSSAEPASVVELTVSNSAGSSPAPELRTSRGLTFDIAAAVCDLYGRQTSADPWQGSFEAEDATVNDDTLVLAGDLTLDQPGRDTQHRAVECTVGGSDITPIIQSFQTH